MNDRQPDPVSGLTPYHPRSAKVPQNAVLMRVGCEYAPDAYVTANGQWCLKVGGDGIPYWTSLEDSVLSRAWIDLCKRIDADHARAEEWCDAWLDSYLCAQGAS